MPLDVGRVQKELKEIEKDQASGVRVVLRGTDLALLTGWVPGPRDTPYDGGQYEIAIELPDQYPFVPPKMRFVTKARAGARGHDRPFASGRSQQGAAAAQAPAAPAPPQNLRMKLTTLFWRLCWPTSGCAQVWHPNISSQNGAICLDILKDQWSPALTIKTAMLSLQVGGLTAGQPAMEQCRRVQTGGAAVRVLAGTLHRRCSPPLSLTTPRTPWWPSST